MSDTEKNETQAGQVTLLLQRVCDGEKDAADRLLPLVYDELRARARYALRSGRDGDTLQPTALVHEAYLRMVEQGRKGWNGRTHFYAVAAIAMRRVLVDSIRRRRRQKRGGDEIRVTLTDAVVPGVGPDVDAFALGEALERLAALNERQARVVELRFFAGLGVDEVADLLDVSKRTVEMDWTFAKAWLKAELTRDARNP